jgi:O-antigen ligase
MHHASTGGLSPIRQISWLQRARLFLREQLTISNLIGLSGAVCALFLLIGLREPWNFRIPLYCVILIWTILRPRTALYLMAFAVPWGSLDIITVAGLRLNSADILVVLLGAGWLMSFALRPMISCDHWATKSAAGPLDHEASTAPAYLVCALLLLIGTMLLSMRASISIGSSLKEISKWLEFLVLILIGSQYIRTRQQVWTIIVLVCLGGITQAFFGYLQAFFNLGPEAFIRDTSLRVYGTFDQPNPFAGYLNLPLSIALALMLLGSSWLTRILAGLVNVFLAAAVYLTQSRGGEIAIATVLFFIMIVGSPHLRRFAALLALAGVGILEVFFTGWIPTYVITPVLKYLGIIQISFTAPSAQDYSTAERLAHWIAGVRMFVDHPLTGIGVGNYPDAYSRYFVTIFVNSLGHAHNYYINIAAETGAIGLTAFLLFLMAVFVAGGKAYSNINKKYTLAQAKAGSTKPSERNVQAPLGTRDKLILLIHPLKMYAYFRSQGSRSIWLMLGNDRALAIGLLGALVSVCVHNLVDDLYVHSLTNLIALLLIALIRLDGVTKNVGGNGGYFDYSEIAK